MTRYLALTETEELELIQLRDHAPKPYLRERAAALLKVAAGQSAASVARHGLLRPRKRTPVSLGLAASLTAGFAGLPTQAGRGRKPAFPPLRPGPDRRGGSGG